MLKNDSYKGPEWDNFFDKYMLTKNRKVFRFSVLLRRMHVPNFVIRFLNQTFGDHLNPRTTVVCNLKEFTPNKKVRYALRNFPVDEVVQTSDYALAEKFVNDYRKTKGLPPIPSGNIKALNELGRAKTFFAMKNGEPVGCLTIAEGDKWITELIAAGQQDAIKMHVIDSYRSTHDYYDLAGYDGSERSRFKKKWGEVMEVGWVY